MAEHRRPCGSREARAGDRAVADRQRPGTPENGGQLLRSARTIVDRRALARGDVVCPRVLRPACALLRRAVRAGGDGRGRAARHVREHLEPAPGTSDRPQPRDGHSHLSWRDDGAAGQTVSGRKPPAGDGWRRGQHLRLVDWTSTFLARAVFGRSGELPPVFALDARVWVFAAVLSIGCALAFGLAASAACGRRGAGPGHHRQSARQHLCRR